MLGYYNRSVILTYIGLVAAILGCRFALGGRVLGALLCLLASGVCDMFDGTIARATKRSAEAQSFGIQIDSLCDCVSFGILPAVILLSVSAGPAFAAVAALYALAAVIRLGFFNVHEQIRQQTSREDKTGVRGLPVTFAAWVIPSVFVFRPYMGARGFSLMLLAVMLAMAVLFVVDFPVNKPKRKWLLYGAGLLWIALMAALLLFQRQL